MGRGAGALNTGSLPTAPFKGRCITNYVPWFPGDYLRDTLHLTWLEDLAYRRLLDIYYSTEKPLPGDEQKLFRMVRANVTEEQTAVRSVLDAFFSRSQGGLWHNTRADTEIRKRAQWRERKQRERDKYKQPTENVTRDVTPLSRRSPSPSPTPHKTPLPPLRGGVEHSANSRPPAPRKRGDPNGNVRVKGEERVVYIERYGEIIEAHLGNHKRLPSLDSVTGARAQQVAEFLTHQGYPSTVVRKE